MEYYFLTYQFNSSNGGYTIVRNTAINVNPIEWLKKSSPSGAVILFICSITEKSYNLYYEKPKIN